MRKKLIRLFASVLLLLALPALAAAAEFAVVKGGRLNLREYADASSRSLGKYATGTWVIVEQQTSSNWWRVRTLDNKSGYMSAAYLNLGSSAGGATVKYANGGYVNLRSGPSLNYSVVVRVNSGSALTILNDSNEWNYVSVVQNGYTYTGYMHDSLISRGGSTATVSTRNGGRVNLRSGPSSSYSSIASLGTGTRLTVLLKGSGWYKVSANGLTGFMSTQYISNADGGTNNGVRYAYVNNPLSTQVLNLRETPSQSSRSIGQYRNGVQVKVVNYGNTWCEVYVGTRHGYMMTRYLSFNGSYTTPPPMQPHYIQIMPTPTPLVQWITPVPVTDGYQPPKAGDTIVLALAAGNSSTRVIVYNDSSMASVKGVYDPGKQATMLQFGTSVCMILIDGGVGYVPTANVNY
ncbi:MAG: SH3 domain-containing protein [Clostridia bacterium]|nr:SH3 domain-containing protein [Clostridia bacterium]